MKLMKYSVILMAVLTAMMVAASCIAVYTASTDLYTSAIFLVGAALLLIVQVVCLIRYPFSLRKIGFYVCHLGLVVTLAGGFLSGALLTETQFSIPIDPGAAYGEVQNRDGSTVEFGFQIGVSDFSVEKYDPEYQLIRRDDARETGYAVLKKALLPDRFGFYELGAPYGQVSREQLMDEAGFVDLIRVGEDVFLSKLSQSDKSYEATLDLYDQDGKRSVQLRINQPCTYRGWKFYLMDYDHAAMSTVSLYAKNDPGNLTIGVGLWMLMAGTACMCFGFFERREKR